MDFHIFGNRGQVRNQMILPNAYRTNVRWRPQLGDIFPDFTANSTQGQIEFHSWAEGNWIFLFSIPSAFNPVCTSEVADVAQEHAALTARSVKPISISVDHLSDLSLWSTEIAESTGRTVDYPLIADPEHVITQAAGMEHPKEIDGQAIRKSFLIDPSLRIRMIFEYPVQVGRSMDEVLRVIDALQAVAGGDDVATPSDWQRGEPLLQVGTSDLEEALSDTELSWAEMRSYLKVHGG